MAGEQGRPHSSRPTSSRHRPATARSTLLSASPTNELARKGRSSRASTARRSLVPAKAGNEVQNLWGSGTTSEQGEVDDALQWALEQNKETLASLKKENKELLARKHRPHERGEVTTEAERMREKVQNLRHQYDERRQRNQRLKKEVSQLQDKAKELEKAAEKPAEEDNELTRTIRSLENKLEKIRAKCFEAQSAQKTYEQLLRRLKDDRVGRAEQLAELESVLSSRNQALEELNVEYHGVNHAKESSMRRLMQEENKLRSEREQKRSELNDLRKHAEAKRRAITKLEDQVKGQFAEMDQAANDASKASGSPRSEETPSQANLSPREDGTTAEEESAEMVTYERALNTLADKVGVTQVKEIPHKLTSQQSTREQLEQMANEASGRMERLQAERDRLKGELERVRYAAESTDSSSEGSRRNVEEAEKRLAEARHAANREKERHERAASELVKLRAGVEHLASKLSVNPDDSSGGPVALLTAIKERLSQLPQPSAPPSDGFGHEGDLSRPLPSSNFRVRLSEPNQEEEEPEEPSDDDAAESPALSPSKDGRAPQKHSASSRGQASPRRSPGRHRGDAGFHGASTYAGRSELA